MLDGAGVGVDVGAGDAVGRGVGVGVASGVADGPGEGAIVADGAGVGDAEKPARTGATGLPALPLQPDSAEASTHNARRSLVGRQIFIEGYALSRLGAN